jgi:hypothetical protein
MERVLKEELASAQSVVVRGDEHQVTDWADYRYQCGRIRGIQFAMDRLVELRAKVEVDEGF